MMDEDYRKLGFRCGIEIHRQLASDRKLFCGCKNEKSDEFPLRISRNLRAVAGELGKVDAAALHEAMRRKTFVYNYNPDTACLVELDDEPPADINREALGIAIVIARMLNMRIVDEMHVMRKTVVDGSSVSGFQRTALLGYGGYVETSEGRVGIANLSIEEDSAPKVLEDGSTVHYRLDRLGVPLVEIGTDADIMSPGHCREVAEKLGMILKSTGMVKRGIGTIRQDVNVSIKGGARVEVKGAQDLRMIPELVRLEVERQKSLADIRSQLKAAGFRKHECSVSEVTDVFSKSESRIVRERNVYALKIAGLAGFFRKKLNEHRTLGNEVANYARVKAQVKGIIHTDEDLSKYGLEAEFERLCGRLKARRDDLLVIVANEKEVAFSALRSVCERVNQLLVSVPEETRRALPNGDSEYMRPLPGASRMYPETDVGYVMIDKSMVEGVKLPETMDEKKARFVSIGLNSELSLQVVNSDYLAIFEECVSRHGADPKVAANLFVNVLPDLKKREGVDASSLSDCVFFDMFDMLREGKITRDVMPVILKYAAESGSSVQEIVEEKGLLVMSEAEARKIIAELIKSEKGSNMKQVIGKAMGKLRGKIENRKIVEFIKDEMGE